jgi:RNA polymerase primary sigma factor
MKQLTIQKNAISNPGNKDLFNVYLADLIKYKPLTGEEEVELVLKIKGGDLAAREKLCLHNLRFVVSVVKQYQFMINNSCLALEDLIMEGNFGLIKAADRFDHTRGFKFISYAVWWIRQAVLECIMNNLKHIRIPTNKIMLHNKLAEIERQLEQLNDRSVDIVEIYDKALEENVVLPHQLNGQLDSMCYNQSFNKPASLNAPFNYNGNDATNLLDVLANEDSVQPDKILIEKNVHQIISDYLDEMDMPPFIKSHFVDMFGLNGELPLNFKEIAIKHELTGERIRQRINKWSAEIRKYDRKNGNFLKNIFHDI